MNQQAGSYLSLAIALARAEAAPTLARVAQKQVALRLIRNRAQETCCCSAYTFPHRSGSGWCPGIEAAARDELAGHDERTRQDIDAEMLALHDRAEARAINSGAW